MANQITLINALRGQCMVFEAEIKKVRQLLQAHELRIAELEMDVSDTLEPAASIQPAPMQARTPDEEQDYEIRRVFQGFAVFQGMKQHGDKGSQADCEALVERLRQGN